MRMGVERVAFGRSSDGKFIKQIFFRQTASNMRMGVEQSALGKQYQTQGWEWSDQRLGDQQTAITK
eukprot:1143426-Pelagomonas_calceolata.AAC.2